MRVAAIADRATLAAYRAYAALARIDIGIERPWANSVGGRTSRFHPLQACVEDAGAGWYRLQERVVTGNGVLLDLSLTPGIERALTGLFGSRRAINLWRRGLADVHAAVLRAATIRDIGSPDSRLLLPDVAVFRNVARLERLGQVEYSRGLGFLWITAQALASVRALLRALRFVPCWRVASKPVLLKALLRGFRQRNYTERVFMDRVTGDDQGIKFFSGKGNRDATARQMVADAEREGFAVERTEDLHFNVRSYAFRHFFANFFPAVLGGICISVLTVPSLLPAIASYASLAPEKLRLLSRVTPRYLMDEGDETNGIVTPIICDWMGVRTLLMSHTCNTNQVHYSVSFTAHHVLFVWGARMHWRSFLNSLNDEVWAIGCMMANCFRGRTRQEILTDLELPENRPIVTFFDNGFGERFRESDYRSFAAAAVAYAETHPEVFVVWKAKSDVLPEFASRLDRAGVRTLTKNDIWLGDMLEVSAACVGMGITNVTQVALYRGAETVMFDTTGFRQEEYQAYEGVLVVRDAHALSARLDEILSGSRRTPEIVELADYQLPGVDSFALVRRYLADGTLPDRHRVADESKIGSTL